MADDASLVAMKTHVGMETLAGTEYDIEMSVPAQPLEASLAGLSEGPPGAGAGLDDGPQGGRSASSPGQATLPSELTADIVQAAVVKANVEGKAVTAAAKKKAAAVKAAGGLQEEEDGDGTSVAKKPAGTKPVAKGTAKAKAGKAAAAVTPGETAVVDPKGFAKRPAALVAMRPASSTPAGSKRGKQSAFATPSPHGLGTASASPALLPPSPSQLVAGWVPATAAAFPAATAAAASTAAATTSPQMSTASSATAGTAMVAVAEAPQTADQKRDVMKSRRFNSLWANKQLPKEAQTLVDEALAARSRGTPLCFCCRCVFKAKKTATPGPSPATVNPFKTVWPQGLFGCGCVWVSGAVAQLVLGTGGFVVVGLSFCVFLCWGLVLAGAPWFCLSAILVLVILFVTSIQRVYFLLLLLLFRPLHFTRVAFLFVVIMLPLLYECVFDFVYMFVPPPSPPLPPAPLSPSSPRLAPLEQG